MPAGAGRTLSQMPLGLTHDHDRRIRYGGVHVLRMRGDERGQMHAPQVPGVL